MSDYGFGKVKTLDEANALKRELAKTLHPDAGGTNEQFAGMMQQYAEAIHRLQNPAADVKYEKMFEIKDLKKLFDTIFPGSSGFFFAGLADFLILKFVEDIINKNPKMQEAVDSIAARYGRTREEMLKGILSEARHGKRPSEGINGFDLAADVILEVKKTRQDTKKTKKPPK